MFCRGIYEIIMAKKHKNVYIGKDSTAGIQVKGKVDQDWEILVTLYATAYDAVNNDTMLTRTPGQYDEADFKEVHGRFYVLKMLAGKYAPHLKPEIEKIEKLTLKNMKGQISDKEYLRQLRQIAIKHGVPTEVLDEVEFKIDMAESMTPNMNFDFNLPESKNTNLFNKMKEPKFDFKFDFGNSKSKKQNKQLGNIAPPKLDFGLDFGKPNKNKKTKQQGFLDFNFDLGFGKVKRNKTKKKNQGFLDFNFDFDMDFFNTKNSRRR